MKLPIPTRLTSAVRNAGPVAGLAVILLVGSLALAAAHGAPPDAAQSGLVSVPTIQTTPSATQGTSATATPTHQGTGPRGNVAAPTASATNTPDPSATPTPTAPTPPTPTPTTPPAPTPTPTTAPSWHTLVSWSGDTQQNPAGTFTTAYSWRLMWGCVTSGAVVLFPINYTDASGNMTPGYADCGPGNTSGIVSGPTWPASGGTYSVSVMDPHAQPLPPWTVTVEVWY